MIKKNRTRQTIVGLISVVDIGPSGIVQVGDVRDEVDLFSYGEVYAGYRGAASFAEEAILEPVNTRLHYQNQSDEDVSNDNIWGPFQEVLRPNIRGEKAR